MLTQHQRLVLPVLNSVYMKSCNMYNTLVLTVLQQWTTATSHFCLNRSEQPRITTHIKENSMKRKEQANKDPKK